MDESKSYHLFECFGVELEYMIVNRNSLNVMPITDRLFNRAHGRIVSEIERGTIAWSNELVLHVVEFKTNGPAAQLEGLADEFHQSAEDANTYLADFNARLMPTAMHPWMIPLAETQIWPHDYSDVYEAYHRIFGCEGHGWSNLQSMHLNLPFCGDDEFHRLHSAIRLVLPLLPALAASSPYVEGRWTGQLDNRLSFYQNNQCKIPEIAGEVIPEAVASQAQYQSDILEKIYTAIRPHDPMRILQHEWLNSRGAIARFDRSAIEIRVLDVQEAPKADIACAQLIVGLLKRLAQMPDLPAISTSALKRIFDTAVISGGQARVEDTSFLSVFGLPARPLPLSELLHFLKTEWIQEAHLDHATLDLILKQGPVAQRLFQRLGTSPTRQALETTFAQLCDCLDRNELFEP